MGTKSFIHNKGIKRSFKEGDVWWAVVGENVGVEIDGKSQKYSRPIIILKKHSNLFFAATPLTSQSHNGTWYTQFVFQGKNKPQFSYRRSQWMFLDCMNGLGGCQKVTTIELGIVTKSFSKKYALTKD